MAKIRIKSVNHVGIPIDDRARSVNFFRDTAGLNVIPHQVDGNTLAWMECLDNSMIHVIDPPADPKAPDGRQHVAFEVEDFDAVVEALAEAGIPLSNQPGVRHDGQRHLFVHDPDGNRIEICTRADHSRTTRTVDENGYTQEG